MWVLLVHGAPYEITVYGMTRGGASQLVMLGLIGVLIGAPLTGWFYNRVASKKRLYIVIQVIVFLSWTTFLVSGGKPPFVMLMLIYLLTGYGSGAEGVLTFVFVRNSFPGKSVGVATGFANSGGFLSAVLLPIIFGWVLDHFE